MARLCANLSILSSESVKTPSIQAHSVSIAISRLILTLSDRRMLSLSKDMRTKAILIGAAILGIGALFWLSREPSPEEVKTQDLQFIKKALGEKDALIGGRKETDTVLALQRIAQYQDAELYLDALELWFEEMSRSSQNLLLRNLGSFLVDSQRARDFVSQKFVEFGDEQKMIVMSAMEAWNSEILDTQLKSLFKEWTQSDSRGIYLVEFLSGKPQFLSQEDIHVELDRAVESFMKEMNWDRLPKFRSKQVLKNLESIDSTKTSERLKAFQKLLESFSEPD